MACINPPVLAKPAKGYSWVCLPCSLQRHKDVQEQKFHFVTSDPAPKPGKAGAQAKEKTTGTSQRPDNDLQGLAVAILWVSMEVGIR